MCKVKPIYGYLFKYIPYPIGLEFHWGEVCSLNVKSNHVSPWRPKWILRWWFKRSNAFNAPYNWWLWNTTYSKDDTWEGQGIEDLLDKLWESKYV